MKSTAEVVRVGEAYAWIEQQKEIHLKAMTKDGQPVALSAGQVRDLADRLSRLASTLESLLKHADE